jgi:MoaD family protein
VLRVRLYATLRPIVGAKVVELDLESGATVAQLVDELVGRWPDLAELLLDDAGGLSRRVNVFLDGRSVRHLPEGTATVLTKDHEIDVFPAVAGGRSLSAA